MSAVFGTWNTQLKSVLGNGDFTLEVADAPARATLTSPEAVQEATAVAVDGDTVSFMVDVEKPMKLQIAWKLTADGDAIIGTAKAGSLPAAKVRGTRA